MLHFKNVEVVPNNETCLFFCAFFPATSSLLSSARWVCCDELPLMIINEIRAHYNEFDDHQPVRLFLLMMIKVGSGSSPREPLVLVVCCRPVSRGRAAARGLSPPYGRHMYPVICSCRDSLLLCLYSVM